MGKVHWWVTCNVCGANCDPGELRNGICEDCRNASAEVEFRIPKKVTDRRIMAAYEEAERNSV